MSEGPSRVTFEQSRPDDYLERLAASDLGRAYKALVVRELAIEPGAALVDLGCGPGADLLAFSDAVGPTGSVLGLDTAADAVALARERVAGRTNVSVRTADIHAPGLDPGSVTHVHTDRVLQHVEEPEVVLGAARAALRPGGRAVFAEPDWDTLVIDYPDPRVPVSYRAFVTERVVRNSRIGRQLPRLTEGAGLIATRVVPITATYRDVKEADETFGFQRVTGRAVAAGYLTATDADAWLDHLATEPFFASVTVFVVVAERAR